MTHEAGIFLTEDPDDECGTWGWLCTCGDERGGYDLLADADEGAADHEKEAS